MKTIKITAILLIVSLFTFTSCKKEAGFGGDNNIVGTVTYKGTAMPNAIVHLAIKATAATTTYDATTLTDASGKYSFKGLNKGDYFVDADYTNGLDIKLESGGAKVTVGAKKGDVTVNLTVE